MKYYNKAENALHVICTVEYSDTQKNKATQHNTRPETTFAKKKRTQVGFEHMPHAFYM